MSENDKFIGAYIPTEMEEQLSLWVFTQSTSKSKLIRDLLKEWMEKQSFSNDALITQIANNLSTEWKAKKSKTLKSLKGREDKLEVAFELHKSEIRQRLCGKGLGRKHVNQIIAKLEI